VVVPTAPFFQRQICSGAYLSLDKTKLPNFANLDPAIMARVALDDPGNAHEVVYAWRTYGIGYNENMLAEVLPGVPVGVYPTADQQRRLFVQMDDSPEQSRAMTRIWQKFKTAQ
jgi:hypothetical protein